MILDRVFRDVVARHNMKRYELSPTGGRGRDRHWSKRTGWSGLYKSRRTARYPNLLNQLNRVREITPEERIEVLVANLAGSLMDDIEDFALYVLCEVTTPEARAEALRAEMRQRGITPGQLQNRLMRANALSLADGDEPAASEANWTFEEVSEQFFRIIARKRVDEPVLLVGEDKETVLREQEDLSRRLVPVRGDLTQLLIREIRLDVDAGSLVVVWQDAVAAMMAEAGLVETDTGLFRLDRAHLWLGLAENGTSSSAA